MKAQIIDVETNEIKCADWRETFNHTGHDKSDDESGIWNQWGEKVGSVVHTFTRMEISL